jgi:hypothetical protein
LVIWLPGKGGEREREIEREKESPRREGDSKPTAVDQARKLLPLRANGRRGKERGREREKERGRLCDS